MMQIEKKVGEDYPELDSVINFFQRTPGSAFEQIYEDGLKIIAAEPNKLTWQFIVEDKHTNRYGNLHGGLVATLIDMCSSFALKLSTGTQWELIGVSTNMSIAYMKGVAPGNKIKLVSEVERVGRTLANIYTRIYNEQGQLCYSGSHSKFNNSAKL
ncbi:hypothetical protein G6F38_011704 [Rhizopus arrhizus]|nr:hypothetical protein G6F38_011704 [Rhizopus arrhizus]